MINRRVTRVILNSTEITDRLAQPNGANYVLALQTSDALYVGYHGKFSSRYFQVGVGNAVVSSVSVTYWDGSNWTAVDDIVDQTQVAGATLGQSGFISWVNKDNWVARSLTGIDSDVELYWVKLTVSVNLSGTTALKSVLNVYSDNVLLSAYFPELVSDTNYLPPGASNFLAQHVAAKDLVVLRLKQRKAIQSDSQIIDANEVAVAATYACAKLILQPIATSEAARVLYDMASKGFDDEIGRVQFSVDENEDGLITDAERGQSFSVQVTRR